MKPVINSNKHIVQIGIDSAAAATVKNVNLIQGVDAPSAGNFVEVRTGAIVKAVYVEIWLLAGSQQPGSITVILAKYNADQAVPTFAEMATLHTWSNKKNVLYTTQGLTPDANGNPVPFMRGWYKIPKGKQRFGLADKLRLTISANLEDASFCGLVIYKEYN